MSELVADAERPVARMAGSIGHSNDRFGTGNEARKCAIELALDDLDSQSRGIRLHTNVRRRANTKSLVELLRFTLCEPKTKLPVRDRLEIDEPRRIPRFRGHDTFPVADSASSIIVRRSSSVTSVSFLWANPSAGNRS